MFSFTPCDNHLDLTNIWDENNRWVRIQSWAKTGKNFGYLDWSLCFEDTVDEMMVVGKDLHNLLEKYGGFKSYTFGSSVIFRAILTSILMYIVINNIL